ncbi:hypothetical protein RB213_013932, partial [Colletotrichum asianum]
KISTEYGPTIPIVSRIYKISSLASQASFLSPSSNAILPLQRQPGQRRPLSLKLPDKSSMQSRSESVRGSCAAPPTNSLVYSGTPSQESLLLASNHYLTL